MRSMFLGRLYRVLYTLFPHKGNDSFKNFKPILILNGALTKTSLHIVLHRHILKNVITIYFL